MKYQTCLFFTFFTFLSLLGYAQPGFVQNDRLNTLKIFDANGKAFVNPLIDIEGSPFLIDQWEYATVKLNNNTSYTNVPVKLNLYSEKIHFLSGTNELTFIPGFVKEFMFIDSSAGKTETYIFRNGFPSINHQDNNSYYRILSDGKLKYLEYQHKKIYESKNELSGEKNKQLISYDDYYFFNEGSLKLLKKSKDFILDQMSDKKDSVEKFIQNNKINCKDPEKIKLVVTYYNSFYN